MAWNRAAQTPKGHYAVSYSIESEPDPFGAPVVASGNFAYDNPFRFSTKHADDETSLIYYGYPRSGGGIGEDSIAREPSEGR